MYEKRYEGDCLEIMPTLLDKSIDMILCDLPYGATSNPKDIIIPFEPLWSEYRRLIKNTGIICLTAMQPFSSMLVMSNMEMFKYDWIWEKPSDKGHFNAKKQPMRAHEHILIFYNNQSTYNPQKTFGHVKKQAVKRKELNSVIYNNNTKDVEYNSTERYPRSVQIFKQDTQQSSLHPNQKPVALFEYLIKTYSNEGDVILDNCAGSFTTAIAAINTNRKYICIEKDPEYFRIGTERIKKHIESLQVK